MALRFRAAAYKDGSGFVIKAGELSPHALNQRWRTQLESYSGSVAAKPHLELHEIEMVVAKDRLETVRVAPDLAARGAEVLAALRDAAQRSDVSWVAGAR